MKIRYVAAAWLPLAGLLLTATSIAHAQSGDFPNRPIRILTSGGPEKTEALIGAMKLLNPTVLITDEESARKMIEHRNGRPL